MRSPHEAWTLRRVMTGHADNGELQALSEPFGRLAVHLTTLPLEDRQTAWDGFLCGRADADALIAALVEVDPNGPPPGAQPPPRPATLADVRKVMAESQWL